MTPRPFNRGPDRTWRGAILAVIATLSGCSVGPDFKRPALWSPAAWLPHARDKAGDQPVTVASVVDPEPPDPHWWDVFHDPELSALEARAAQTNLNVRLATVRLAESRAQLRITGADQYPTINGTGRYMRTQVSSKLVQRGLESTIDGIPAGTAGSGAAGLGTLGGLVGGGAGTAQSTLSGIRQYAGSASVPPFDIYEDGIDASYELDLWGRVRREVESAQATAAASVEDRRSVLIAQLAEVARDYMTLRGDQTILRILLANQKTAEDSLRLTRQRYAGGLTTELDVDNARAQLTNTTAQIPSEEEQVSQEVNAISLLLGEPPQALRSELLTDAALPPIPPLVPVGGPSELARRRPDIREAEEQLHSATASVGVAVASFYPRVTLTGALNFQTLSLRDLAFWSAAAYNVGPSISLPIFQGGRLRGQLQLSKARQQEAAINYQQTVLTAWHDVDNALAAYAAEQRRNDQLVQSVTAAQRALVLAREQYLHGLQTFLNVLDAQRTLLSAQQQLATSAEAESANLVQLYTALGGGWETTFPVVNGAAGGVRGTGSNG